MLISLQTSESLVPDTDTPHGEAHPDHPSVLPADWANMGAECKRLEDAGVDRIQFDVLDATGSNLTCRAAT